ncbi:hypothetical protein MLD38_019364 [Melastoma candidum]|nr:hypothetical protein MLD38_019364 [Melastoma candidum]
MLENDDMMHFLRALGVGGGDKSQPSFDLGIDNYPLPHGYNDMYSNAGTLNTSSHSSGKAVVGWLKLKAALRWGIFVRKKAAERRAQLVELDDMHTPE